MTNTNENIALNSFIENILGKDFVENLNNLDSTVKNTTSNAPFSKDFDTEVEIEGKENVTARVERNHSTQLSSEKPFIAHLGKNRKVTIKLEDYEYDKELSDLGNAKHVIQDYLSEHDDLLDILESVDDNDSDIFKTSVDTSEEAVKTITNIVKHTDIIPVVEFPANITFDVVAQLKEKELEPVIYPAGEKNVLTF